MEELLEMRLVDVLDLADAGDEPTVLKAVMGGQTRLVVVMKGAASCDELLDFLSRERQLVRPPPVRKN